MNHTIFVGGISGIEESRALNFFQSLYNSVEKIVIPKHEKSKRVKGYALLYVSKKPDYDNLLQMQKVNIHGRIVHLKPYLKGKNLKRFKNSVQNRRVHVRGIPKKWKNADFRRAMRQIGPFEDAYIIHDPSGKKSYGFGYALFHEEETANKALKDGSQMFPKLKIQFEKRGEKKNQQDSQPNTDNQSPNDSSPTILGWKQTWMPGRAPKPNGEVVNQFHHNKEAIISSDLLISLHSVKPTQKSYFNRVKTLSHHEAEVLGQLRFNKLKLRFGNLNKFEGMMKSLSVQSNQVEGQLNYTNP